MQGECSGMGFSMAAFELAFDVTEDLVDRGLRAIRFLQDHPEQCDRPVRHIEPSGEVLLDLLKTAGLQESTALRYAKRVCVFLQKVGGRRLQDLRDDDVYDFLDRLREARLGNAVLRQYLSAIRKVFDKLLGLSITVGICYAPPPPPRPPATDEEINTLAAHCHDPTDVEWLFRLNQGSDRLSQIAAAVVGIEPGSGSDGDLHLVDPNGMLPPGRFWLLPSPRDSRRHMSERTLRARLQRLAARCGLKLCSTQILHAETVLPLPLPRASAA